MKKIIIELIEDEKSGGYTIISDDIHDGAIIAEGDDIIDALENFKNTLIDVDEYLKEENKNG